MNANDRRPYPAPSAWEVETERFHELFERWLDYRLNKFFDLSIHGPGYRRYWTMVLGAAFIAGAFIVHSLLHLFPLLAHARTIQLASLPLFALLTVVRLALLLFIPSYIAITIAGNYLADIFELKDASVAWNFISDLSINGANEVIHIRDGRVSEESQHSPVLWIGGPGRVEVEFDSAALFEKPDGTPHVVGRESVTETEEDERPDNTILEGFERLREPIINLRDQYIGNPSAEPMTVVSRSQDGIVVSAADVRAVFSVHRVQQNPDEASPDDIPYTYHPNAIETLTYQQAVPVLTEGPYASGEPGNWAGAMQGLLRGTLADFMSRNRLADYLASIGLQERELSEYREDTILSRTVQAGEEFPVSGEEEPSTTSFHPRNELSNRFKEYTQGFSQQAHRRGLDLHWIGVGTWKLPDPTSSEKVDGQHLDAWRINHDNAFRSSTSSLEAAAEESYRNEKLKLIQNVPLGAHQKNRNRYSDKMVLIEALVGDYLEQLGDVLEDYYQSGTSSRDLETLERGVSAIEELPGFRKSSYYSIGHGFSRVRARSSRRTAEDAPPAPGSREEAQQYQYLLGKLDGNYRVVESIIALEAQRHPSMTRAEHIRRIVERYQRYAR